MKIFILFVVCGSVWAQQAAFEVATVDQVQGMTLADVLRGRSTVSVDDAYATLRGQSAVMLIRRAYGVTPDQILKLPDSSRSIYFDVRAKIPAGVSQDRVPEMLQALLAERFKLAIHRQEETRPIYQLTVADSGTKKMTASEGAGPGKCQVESGHHVCHAMTMAELATYVTNLQQLAKGVSNSAAAAAAGLTEAANAATDYLVNRPVVDKTGIEGRFEFVLDFGRQPGVPDSEPVRLVDSLTGLGLKLVPVNNKIQIVVIDHIERLPTEN